MSAAAKKTNEFAASYCIAPPCQNIVSSLQSHTKIPTHFSAFERTWVVKWDRTTRKSITLIEADKNTNCALLNCWHWTGWIKQCILTTGDRLEGTVERPCHGVSALDGFEAGHDKKNKRKTSSSDLLVWSLLMYYKVIYTLRYINSVKKFKTISPTLNLKQKKKMVKQKHHEAKLTSQRLHCFRCWSLHTRDGDEKDRNINTHREQA